MLVLGSFWQLPRHVQVLARSRRATGGAATANGPDAPSQAGDDRELPDKQPALVPAPTDLSPAVHVRVVPAVAAVATPAAHDISALAEPARENADETPATAGVVRRSWGRNGQYTREVVAIAWVIGSAMLCYVLGFRLGIAIFAAAYGLIAAGRSLGDRRRKLAFAAMSVVVLYLVVTSLFAVLGLYEDPVLFIPMPTF
jgi:hypothetical protein